MKKTIKLVYIVILFVFFINNLYAKEDYEDIGLSHSSSEQVEKAKQATADYCDESKTVKGCIYDKNNSIYTEFKPSEMGEDAKYYFTDKIKSLPLVRGYVAFNGKGEAIYAGCYRYDYKKSDFLDDNGNFLTREFAHEDYEDGSFFVFKIVSQKKNTCDIKNWFFVPAKGVYMGSNKDVSRTVISTGHLEDYVIDSGNATISNGWTATKGGDCPKLFGYTSNAKVYTTPDHKYYFSNNEDDYYGIEAYSFWGNEQYLSRPGCTVKDVAGEEEQKKLLSDIEKEIKSMNCPDNLNDSKAFNEFFTKKYESLVNDNKYRVLYSKEYASEMTIDKAQTELSKFVHDKMITCQYKKCGLTDSEISKVNSNKTTKCSNGCTINNLTAQSKEDKAKCYCCGGSKGCTYKWTVESDYTKSSCALKSKMTKNACLGTTDDEECRNCLSNAYNKAGLSDAKKECLAEAEITTELTINQIDLENKNKAEQSVEEEMEANVETRERLFTKQFEPTEWMFGSGNKTCEQILGKVLTKVVKSGITIMQIICALIAIVKGMMILVPAVMAKDADALKKASRTLMMMGIILAIVIIFRPVIRLLGSLLGFDTSCII